MPPISLWLTVQIFRLCQKARSVRGWISSPTGGYCRGQGPQPGPHLNFTMTTYTTFCFYIFFIAPFLRFSWTLSNHKFFCFFLSLNYFFHVFVLWVDPVSIESNYLNKLISHFYIQYMFIHHLLTTFYFITYCLRYPFPLYIGWWNIG